MSKTEIQRQLEKLGFKSKIDNQPNSNKILPKTNSVTNTTILSHNRNNPNKKTHEKPDENARIKSEYIIRNMHKNHKNWSSTTFKVAIRNITGRSHVFSFDEARDIYMRKKDFDSKVYSFNYALAYLLLTGKWIPPKPKQILDSKQTEARCERRDINGNFANSGVFRN